MLVLSRRVGEKIVIDGGITIEVVGILSGNRVRLGITAPGNVTIWRDELLPKMAAEAANCALSDQKELRYAHC